MNERQLKAFIKDAFRMDAVAEDALRLADPAFHQAMLRVRQLVGELPSGSLMRQQYWKQIFPQVAQALAPYNQSLRDALGTGLLGEAAGMRKQAEGLLRSSGLSIEIPEVTPLAEYTQMVLDTKVNGQRLQSLFSGPGGISPWVRSNARVVDQIVSTGISLGISTNDLADQIATQMVVNGNEVLNFHGPTAARRIRVASRALARTSVQDFNKQIQQETWRDNAQVMKEAGFKFEWVAALDSRTCMICGPLDGEVVDEYEEFDDWPIHVNCRCRVVAIDPDNPFFKTAQRRGTQLSDEPTKGKRGGYATKVKVKGEKFFRRAEAVPSTVKPNYAGWLSKSNHLTQAEAFGGGNAGMFRAARFRTSLKRGVSPDKALKDLLKGRSGGLVPIKKLGPGVAKKAASNKALALPKTPKQVKLAAGTPWSKKMQAHLDKEAKAFEAKAKAQLAADAKKQKAKVADILAKKNKAAAAKQAQILGAAEAKKQQAKMDAALKAHEAKQKAAAAAKKAAAQAKAKAQAAVKAKPVVIPPKVGAAQTFYGVNPQAAWRKSPKQVGTGMFGTVVETPAGTVIKRGAITKTEVQALQQLNKSGFTPKLHGVSFLDADWAKTNGFVSRKGFLEMSRAPGDPLHALFEYTSDKQKIRAHDSLLRARKALHLKGIAHQDMHAANVMLKLDTGQITLIDFGTARLDPRAALIEGLGTKRGKIAFGQVRQAGDYQSRELWQGLNPKNLQASNPVAKLFNANRKRVEAILKAEGHARYIDASIRTLPRGTLSKARALELIEMLYEGI